MSPADCCCEDEEVEEEEVAVKEEGESLFVSTKEKLQDSCVVVVVVVAVCPGVEEAVEEMVAVEEVAVACWPPLLTSTWILWTVPVVVVLQG